MVGISLKVPEPLAAQIDATARERGLSRSALVRQAIQVFLSDEQAKRPGSALALVADLVGSCEGPEDLSVSKEYMRGFGE